MRIGNLIISLGLSGLMATTGFAKGDGPTLKKVKAKGQVSCGVSQGLTGFSNPDKKGNWTGIDVDICRAVAAAVTGDAKKVSFARLSAAQRFTALQSGEIDLLSRNTTWTSSRDSKLGIDFGAIVYYDGQGFMVNKKLGVSSAKELDGATVCVQTGTTTELNAADYFRANGLKYKLLAFEKQDETIAAYDSGRCDVYTTDQSGLYANRIKLKNPADHIILPEVISKEPLATAVRHGDNQWGDIVRWTVHVMTGAEDLGINSQNVDSFIKTKNPEIRRLLGHEGSIGEQLGLQKDWAYQIIKQVGNYGEVFERNLGSKSKLKIARGLNNLWNQGGLMYPLPVR